MIGCRRMFFHNLCHDVREDLAGCTATRAAISISYEDAKDTLPASKRIPLKRLENLFKDAKHVNVPVIGRVVQRSGLQVHASPSDISGDKLQLYLHIADESSSTVVVIWGSACRLYLHTIQEGDIILLRNYRIKRATAFSSAFAETDLELSLNSKNPIGILDIVQDADAASLYNLHLEIIPELTSQSHQHEQQNLDREDRDHGAFHENNNVQTETDSNCSSAQSHITWPSPLRYSRPTPRSHLMHHVIKSPFIRPSHRLITIFGMIRHVGRLERHRTKRESFLLFRWIMLQDQSRPNKQTILRLKYNSQPNVFMKLRPGMLMAATNCKVMTLHFLCPYLFIILTFLDIVFYNLLLMHIAFYSPCLTHLILTGSYLFHFIIIIIATL